MTKLHKAWTFVAHPCGYDPYNSYDSSYVANLETVDLHKLREDIVDKYLEVKQQAEALESHETVLFDPDAPLL